MRVRSTAAVSVRAQATVKLPRKRAALRSRPARTRLAAGGAKTLRLRFASRPLRKIKAALRSGRKLSARIRVSSNDGAGGYAVASMPVRLKP